LPLLNFPQPVQSGGCIALSEGYLDSQYDMLQQAGCEKIFGDTVSGVSEYREGWDNLMAYVRPGDTIVIAELSRMTFSDASSAVGEAVRREEDKPRLATREY
jgi:DNA invertase Pin-like site-specific DNA recombinase